MLHSARLRQDAAHVDAAPGSLSARIVRPGVVDMHSEAAPPAPAPERGDVVGQPLQPGGSLVMSGSGPLLRRKLYDQNLSDWTARHRKNRQTLENITRDCEQLKAEVAKQQQDVDEKENALQHLEDHFAHEVSPKLAESKANLDMMQQQKIMLTVQLSENRKHKAQLAKDKKLLSADFERKHQDLLKLAETRDKLEAQLAQMTQHLSQLHGDRRRMERELDVVQNNLRANTELADEVHHEIEHVVDGIRDSMDNVLSVSRHDGSMASLPRD